ncbi:YrdB family protein [Allonocardiopsis opalescens]|uniref:Uncharacterized protein DUF2568 n=1 Tax=Allonocardiopsis opalescens TaxID=1144618 RepID=A0A2T0Q5G7_9ACTN|nr:YrdB family protein [Allonocardiopsis opalescens]PRX99022.1 uncharacterized protein DUF2568 [Allonocardiopsis opalescens]
MRTVNQLLALAIEILMLYAFAWWGFTLDAGLWARVLCGLGAPAAVITVWALWVAPRAGRRLRLPWLAVVKGALFAAAALALYAAGMAAFAVGFAAVAAAHLVIALRLDQV